MRLFFSIKSASQFSHNNDFVFVFTGLQVRAEALNIYRSLYGDDVNPLLQSFEEHSQTTADGTRESSSSEKVMIVDLGKIRQRLQNITSVETESDNSIADEL